MIRVPDFYYTKQPVDGYYEPPGQPYPIEKFRGETLEFGTCIFDGVKPVNFEDYNIRAYVKSNKEACPILWQGENDTGIYNGPNPGTFLIRLTADESMSLIAGTYWLYTTVQGKPTHSPYTFSLPPINFTLKETYAITDPKYTNEATSQQSAPNIFDIKKI